jgi:putative DNA primase/helicase
MSQLRSWARALCGTVYGRSILCPGPRHSRGDRSLSVTPSTAAPGGFVVFSHCGDDWQACRDFVRARLGLPAFAPQRWPLTAALKPSAIGIAAQQAPEPAPELNPNAGFARKIWREAVDIRGTLAESYLASRRLILDSDADWRRVLRFHPSCPFGQDRAPAMIALMRDILTDEPRCIQRTHLTPDGKKIDRQMLGPAKGATIKIDPDADVTMGLCIGEGLETCLTARQCDVKPVWVLGSVGAIEAFPVLAGMDALSILAETGDASARAVRECGDRWEHDGREVFILDSKIGSDVNDALREVAK